MRNIRTLLLCSLAAMAVICTATQAQAAGFQFLEVPSDSKGPALKGAVWYPCAQAAGKLDLGRMQLPATVNCPVLGQHLPMVVISHGTGGSFAGHHDTAEALADAGFVVAAISHPGDNFQDLSRQGHLSAFLTRPVDMQRLVDYMTTQWAARAQLDPQAIGFFGFSRGGYTGLVAGGAVPDYRVGQRMCEHVDFPLCQELKAKELPALPNSDPRIKAAVIADPLSLFGPTSLQGVRIPVQLWSSELGGDGVALPSVEAVRDGLPQLNAYQVAKHAGHFIYLAPCSATQMQALPDICKDPEGVDRAAFHAQFNAKVLAFFQAQLKPATNN